MKKDYLITERPLKALISFVLPMIIGNLFQQFYTMADSVVVGRFVGEKALASVGASYSLTNVFICVAIGGGIGASVLVARYFGAKDYRKMRISISTAMITFFIISLIFAIFGVILGKKIMIALNTPKDILELSVEYLNIYFYGLPFLFMYNILSAMFNALGRSKVPLYLLIFSSIFNVVLDIILVCNFSMGVLGVAWATLIAQGISAILAYYIFLLEMKNYIITEERKKFDKTELFIMTKIALPSIFQQSTVSIGLMLVQSVVNSFGAEMLAGYSAGMRIESICIVPMLAIGNAVSAFTAQNIGAGKFDRVSQGYFTAYYLVLGFAILLYLPLQFFHKEIIEIFLGGEGTKLALDTGSNYLKFIGCFFLFIGLKNITDGVLRGAGDMKIFTLANVVNLSIRVLVAIVFAPIYGIDFVWYAMPIGWLANYIISFTRYRTGKWKRKRLY